MANKRQKKKIEKRRLQNKVVAQTGKKEKEVQKYSYKQLDTIVSQNNKKAHKKKQRNLTYKKKTDFLLSHNIPIEGLTKTQINKIKISDIESGNVNINNYPFLKGRIFDFNEPKVLSENKRLYFAYRDYSQNKDFKGILSEYSGMTDQQLLKEFNRLAKLKPTFRKTKKKKSDSNTPLNETSGQAGTYKFMYNTQDGIEIFHNDTKKENRKKPKKAREHGGEFKGYQVLKSNGRVSIDTASPRKILEVGCGIMSSVTEWDRVAFYKQYHKMIEKEFPELCELIPKPLN